MASLVQAAAASGKQVRAGGKGHMCKLFFSTIQLDSRRVASQYTMEGT